MQSIYTFFIAVLICSVFSSCGSLKASSGNSNQYGKKVYYQDHSPKQYPDFTIKFIGERVEDSPRANFKFTFYDFEVAKGNEKKIVSWSSGTGDIGPLYFNVGGKEYAMEISLSEAYKGFMNDGEMVIWKRKDFEKLLQKSGS